MKLRNQLSTPKAAAASVSTAELKGPPQDVMHQKARVQFGGWLDDVFEAEGAVAGETLALAPAAQVLPVGPLWVNMALRFCTGTTRFVARLERKEPISRDVEARTVYGTYMTCDVLYAVWVKFFLAFPTELLEVNLEHMYALTSLEYCSRPEFLILQQH